MKPESSLAILLSISSFTPKMTVKSDLSGFQAPTILLRRASQAKRKQIKSPEWLDDCEQDLKRGDLYESLYVNFFMKELSEQ